MTDTTRCAHKFFSGSKCGKKANHVIGSESWLALESIAARLAARLKPTSRNASYTESAVHGSLPPRETE